MMQFSTFDGKILLMPPLASKFVNFVLKK